MKSRSGTAALSRSEWRQLEEFLLSVGDTALNVEELDGFFCALVAGPDIVMPSEYWPKVIGTDEFEFTTLEDARRIMDLVMRHWNHIATTLSTEEQYQLILNLDKEGEPHGNDWAAGFMYGLQMRPKSWERFMDKEENSALLFPIFLLANENDPELKEQMPDITPKTRQTTIEAISFALPTIFKTLQANRAPVAEPFRRSEAKVGRNDPCPCGSRKKYKHCCGASSTMH